MHLRGEVGLEDPLSRHLDGPVPAWREREPTLLELATHRSGLPNTPRPLARRELLSRSGGERDPGATSSRSLRGAPGTPARRAPGGRLRDSSIGSASSARLAAPPEPYGELLPSAPAR